jgi:CheY-like chemotaxis protein
VLSVLLIDDDVVVRSCIAEVLAEKGHQVEQAPDGESALSLLEARAFDVAVCDVRLPKLDGLSLLRRIRLS